MQGALLGPEFSESEIEVMLKSNNAVYERMRDDSLLDRFGVGRSALSTRRHAQIQNHNILESAMKLPG